MCYLFRLLLFTSLTGILTLVPVEAIAGGLAGSQIQWPSWQELLRVLTFQDYNTRVVIIGATLLGLAAGLVGTFLLLRKRALLSDAISHATLPGIALAFIVMSLVLGNGKKRTGAVRRFRIQSECRYLRPTDRATGCDASKTAYDPIPGVILL